jgi:ABC-type antimicrobial peptide transport system permease subunit
VVVGDDDDVVAGFLSGPDLVREEARIVLSVVRVLPGESQALKRDHPLTVQTREQFSDKEQQVISDMSTGLIRGMLLIGIVVGLAVAAVSVYTATLARLREYAVLNAIGMPNRSLYALVSRQSLLTVGPRWRSRSCW